MLPSLFNGPHVDKIVEQSKIMLSSGMHDNSAICMGLVVLFQRQIDQAQAKSILQTISCFGCPSFENTKLLCDTLSWSDFEIQKLVLHFLPSICGKEKGFLIDRKR